jgi:hypothetical protein
MARIPGRKLGFVSLQCSEQLGEPSSLLTSAGVRQLDCEADLLPTPDVKVKYA